MIRCDVGRCATILPCCDAQRRQGFCKAALDNFTFKGDYA